MAASEAVTLSLHVPGFAGTVHALAVNNEGSHKATVVLLHGQAFTAAVWQQTGTLQALGGHGVRAVAVDLPGYGATGGPPLSQEQRGAFLADLLRALKAEAPVVLVTPSMSGTYALPFLTDHVDMVAAWVAVAPVGLTHFTGWHGADGHGKLKVLAIYGSRDPMKADYSIIEDALPRAQFLLIPDAGHAAYLDNPPLFNSELLRFLDNEVVK